MLNIGFGVTVLNKSHLDGIGVYTQELYNALKDQQDLKLYQMGFGKKDGIMSLAPNYLSHALHYIIFNKRRYFCNNTQATEPIKLIHATDHYIPAFKNIPVVATIMDLIPFLYPHWVSSGLRGFKNYAFKKLIYSANHIITISKWSKKDLINVMGIDENKISVIPLGVNNAYFDRIEPKFCHTILQKYSLTPGFFLFIGTLQPRKNLHQLMDAHALLPVYLQQKHPLVIVGKMGWGVDNLIEKIKKMENIGTGKWLQHLPQQEVQALLQSALALVFVSLYEGFGLPVLEAFASQCPVIASNATSIPEVAGEAALLVNPADLYSIVHAMKNLINEPKVREDLVVKGLKQAKLFTWKQCARKTIDIYKKLSIETL